MNGRREKERMRESKANRKTEERLIERGASRKRRTCVTRMYNVHLRFHDKSSITSVRVFTVKFFNRDINEKSI